MLSTYVMTYLFSGKNDLEAVYTLYYVFIDIKFPINQLLHFYWLNKETRSNKTFMDPSRPYIKKLINFWVIVRVLIHHLYISSIVNSIWKNPKMNFIVHLAKCKWALRVGNLHFKRIPTSSHIFRWCKCQIRAITFPIPTVLHQAKTGQPGVTILQSITP